MKRHIAWLVACGVLAGCVSEPLPIDAPASPTPSQNTAESTSHGTDSQDSAEAPAAFHFESGTLEIGDFDPYTLGGDIFDPCTEISPEEFAAAGFHNVEPIPEEYAGLARGLSACEVWDEGKFHVGFMNNNANHRSIEEIGNLLEYKSDRLPTLYTHGPRNGTGPDCFAQVDTQRGGIIAAVPGFEGYDSPEDTCAKAIAALESLAEASSAF
ncbi:DUF3558 family protein [Corynebacterium afermentans subsp. lipophilum]|uniref:DUF3558 family protein n=1 Tax=Corynebacterium afermentans TaxID=38286 RepID=UPI00188D927D|nr:DUF3558 family protein [Corynebacterium afermentans]MBF4547762.1 DUF3558 family protein [Corynebacterium afermentans subsp. lipophilum]WJY58523.1 hypothetical protein CAFEL_03720 [Corynebacterium afermentans subsp. lipophilum]